MSITQKVAYAIVAEALGEKTAEDMAPSMKDPGMPDMMAKQIDPGLNAKPPKKPKQPAATPVQTPKKEEVKLDPQLDVTSKRTEQIPVPTPVYEPNVTQRTRDMYLTSTGLHGTNHMMPPSLPPLPIPGAKNNGR